MGYTDRVRHHREMIERARSGPGILFLKACWQAQQNINCAVERCECRVVAPCDACIAKLRIHAAIAGARSANTPEEWKAVRAAYNHVAAWKTA